MKEILQGKSAMLEDNSRTRNHFKARLRYHMIFSTKYRRKCLDQIRDDVFDAFRYCESKSHFTILNMNLDKDHIHLLIEIPPTYSVGQTVSRLKEMTTNYLYREQDAWLRKFFFNKKHRYLWTHGYFVSSVGAVSEKTVWDYINNQGKIKI